MDSANNSAPTPHGIEATLLIPGRGTPISDATVVILDDKILWVGPRKDLPSTFSDIPTQAVRYLLPGLWDCHVHLVGMTSLTNGSYFATTPAHAGLRLARDASALINAGFTSVRELAGFGTEVAKAVREGVVIGPNVYACGAAIGMTGGHTDRHSIPWSVVQDVNAAGSPAQLADGVDSCLRAVRLQVRKGARVIKICGTGGCGAVNDDPSHRQFSDEELKAMVDEASRNKLVVAAHCHGSDGIMACIRAGVKSIEHGSYLTEDIIAEMKKRDVFLVPTRTTMADGLRLPDVWEKEAYEKLRILSDAHDKSYRLAIRKGVKIALGTDLIMSNDSLLGHGRNGREIVLAVEAGMTPLQAIEACTAIAPETLGPQAPKSGQIKEGYDADLIAMDEDPLENIELISEPKNIKRVWKAGRPVKSLP